MAGLEHGSGLRVLIRHFYTVRHARDSHTTAATRTPVGWSMDLFSDSSKSPTAMPCRAHGLREYVVRTALAITRNCDGTFGA